MTIAVVGKSISTGHPPFPPQTSSAGESLHTINGSPVITNGLPWSGHFWIDGNGVKHEHGATTVASSKHTINGKAVAKMGDTLSCGDVIVGGEPLHRLN